MNFYSFEVNPAPNRFFDRDDNGTVPDEFFTNTANYLAEQLEVAYLERVSRYKQDLEKGYKEIRFGNFLWADKRPTVKVDQPGGTETVVFDEELDARLMEIYVLYGWDGMLKLEDALKLVQEKSETRYTEPWPVVERFYLFTRNRLILLIRQTLIEIEKKAAYDIKTRLRLTANAVDTAWDQQFQFDTISSGAEGGPGSESSGTSYTMGNVELSDDLFPLLSEAVNAKTFVDEQNRKIERLEQAIEYFKDEGTSPPNNLEPDRKDAQKLTHQTNTVLETLLEQIRKKVPLALLALPLLKKGFEKRDMVNIIGETLGDFYVKTRNLVDAINPQTSQVETDFPGIQENVPDATRKLERLFSFGYNIEDLYAKKAITNVVDKPVYLALLSEETLHRLIEMGVIEQGTLAYIVCQRYILTLMKQLEERRKYEEKFKKFFDALARLAARLQLAALLTSLLQPEVSPVLEGLAAELAMPMVLFQVYSVIHQLSVFDQVMNLRLAEVDISNIDSLVAVVEISEMRKEYLQQINSTVLKELTLIIAAGQWPIFKQFLHLRGYYTDLEVLLED